MGADVDSAVVLAVVLVAVAGVVIRGFTIAMTFGSIFGSIFGGSGFSTSGGGGGVGSGVGNAGVFCIGGNLSQSSAKEGSGCFTCQETPNTISAKKALCTMIASRAAGNLPGSLRRINGERRCVDCVESGGGSVIYLSGLTSKPTRLILPPCKVSMTRSTSSYFRFLSALMTTACSG